MQAQVVLTFNRYDVKDPEQDLKDFIAAAIEALAPGAMGDSREVAIANFAVTYRTPVVVEATE